MKQTMLILVFLFLGGCADNYPTVIQLDPRISDQPLLYKDITASVQGRDDREYEEVVAYRLGNQPPIRVANNTAPHSLITGLLVSGLQQQGLLFTSQPEVYVTLTINELLATVSKPKFLYAVLAKSKLSLKVIKGRGILTKTYTRETEDEFARRPEVDSLEKMLNEQLAEIIKQILQDEDIRKAILKQ